MLGGGGGSGSECIATRLPPLLLTQQPAVLLALLLDDAPARALAELVVHGVELPVELARVAVGATVVAPTRLATLAVLDARGDELDLERGADKRGNFV